MNTFTVSDIRGMRERRICTKSHYKMSCGCCGKTINRGDEITQVLGSKGRMRARYASFRSHAADAEAGLQTPYAYAPTRNRWVHLTCRPQYFRDWGNGSVGFFPHPTSYSHDLEQRRTAASFNPDWGEDLSDIPYPEWKWETERIEANIIPLQRMVKKKWQKIHQERWRKKVDDAVTTLDKAIEEVIYSWQNDKIYQVSVLLGIDFPQKLINPASPSCDEGYQTSWNKMVITAARTLDYAIRDWECSWQYDIIRDIRKSYYNK